MRAGRDAEVLEHLPERGGGGAVAFSPLGRVIAPSVATGVGFPGVGRHRGAGVGMTRVGIGAGRPAVLVLLPESAQFPAQSPQEPGSFHCFYVVHWWPHNYGR